MTIFNRSQRLRVNLPGPLNLTRDQRLEAARIWRVIRSDCRPRFGINDSVLIAYFHNHCSVMAKILEEL